MKFPFRQAIITAMLHVKHSQQPASNYQLLVFIIFMYNFYGRENIHELNYYILREIEHSAI